MRHFCQIIAIVLAPLLISGCQPIGGSDPLDQTGRIYTTPNNNTGVHGEMDISTSRDF